MHQGLKLSITPIHTTNPGSSPVIIDCIALRRSHKLLLSLILITNFFLSPPRPSLDIAVFQNRYCRVSETARLQRSSEAEWKQQRSDRSERDLQRSSRTSNGLQRGSRATGVSVPRKTTERSRGDGHKQPCDPHSHDRICEHHRSSRHRDRKENNYLHKPKEKAGTSSGVGGQQTKTQESLHRNRKRVIDQGRGICTETSDLNRGSQKPKPERRHRKKKDYLHRPKETGTSSGVGGKQTETQESRHRNRNGVTYQVRGVGTKTRDLNRGSQKPKPENRHRDKKKNDYLHRSKERTGTSSGVGDKQTEAQESWHRNRKGVTDREQGA